MLFNLHCYLVGHFFYSQTTVHSHNRVLKKSLLILIYLLFNLKSLVRKCSWRKYISNDSFGNKTLQLRVKCNYLVIFIFLTILLTFNCFSFTFPRCNHEDPCVFHTVHLTHSWWSESYIKWSNNQQQY